MDNLLEKVDTVVARTNVTFAEAKEALDKNDGDVVEAIIYIENNEVSWSEDVSHKGEEMVDKLKKILKKGNITKITVKKDEEVILNIPVTAVAVGAIMSLPLTFIGLGSALISKCTIEVLKEDGEVIKIK